MRFLGLVVLCGLVCLCGCGGSSGTTPVSQGPQFGIASGNWDLVMLTLPFSSAMQAGGSLTQTGTTISGTLHITGSPCFDPVADDVIVNGTASDGVISMTTVPVRGQTITLTSGSLPPPLPGSNTTIFGSWKLTGGTCADGLQGNVSARLVRSLTGTWKGNVTGLFNAGVTAVLTQTGPDAHGFFHLSGSFSFSGSACFTSGTISNSQLTGATFDVLINTSDAGQTELSGTMDNLGPAAMQSTFDILSGVCSGEFGLGRLTQQ